MTPPSTAAIRDRLLPIALGQAVGLLCGIIGVKIATHLIAPEDYGAYGVFLSFVPLGMWVVHAGLIKFVGRHWAASTDRAGLVREVLRAGGRKLPWLALATGIAAVALSRSTWLQIWPSLFAAALALSFAAFAQAALQAMRAHWTDFAVSASGSLTRTVLPPLFYATAGGSLLTLHAGFWVHATLLAAAGAWCLRGYIGGGASTTPQLAAIYTGPLFVALAVTGWALTAVNRWIAAGFFGAAYAGFFTLAGNLALIVTTMLGVVFMQYFQPVLFAMPSGSLDERRLLARQVDRLALAYTVFALAGVLALNVVAPHLVGLLIGENYRPALGLMVAAGAFATAMTVAQFFHVMLLAGKRESACGPVDLSSAIVLGAGGAIAAALGGEVWFLRWLSFSPIVPWVLTRPLARRFLLREAPSEN